MLDGEACLDDLPECALAVPFYHLLYGGKMCIRDSAAARSSSTIRGPREVLMSRTPSFIFAMLSRLMMPCVSGNSGREMCIRDRFDSALAETAAQKGAAL